MEDKEDIEDKEDTEKDTEKDSISNGLVYLSPPAP